MSYDSLVKDITKTITRDLSGYGKNSTYQVFDDLMSIMAITLSNQLANYSDDREKRYLDIAARYDADWLNAAASILAKLTIFFHENSDDILGRVFHELELHNKHRGQFFTPYTLSKLIAQVTINAEQMERQIHENGCVEINEPTCGSGGMVLACNEIFRSKKIDTSKVMVVAQDIDHRAVHMCYIQLALSNVSATIIRGNTLSVECLEQWYTPAYLASQAPVRKGLCVAG